MNHLSIVYDISVLGTGYYYSRARTGIFRVVESIAQGLSSRSECNLSFCSTVGVGTASQCLDYLSSQPQLKHVPFISSGYKTTLHKYLSKTIEIINSKPKVSIPSKIARRLLLYSTIFLTEDTAILNQRELLKSDIYHSPFQPLPQLIKPSITQKRFLTIYDLIPILYPQFFEFNEDHLIKRVVGSIKLDDWVLCISQATKNDLCNHLPNLDQSRVFVTHLAASELFYPCYFSKEISKVKQKYNIPDQPYVLSLSTLEPRKNIAHTINCFAKLIQQEKIQDLNLALVGTKGWDYAHIFDELSKYDFLQNRVLITGYVADEDLAALYSGALAFVYPSHYEGFGLPPLEAMQCGVPVITSNTSSLPEVVGDAGIMVNPTDEDALCQSMLDIYSSSSLRNRMRSQSLARAKLFSWEHTVQQTIDAYRIALDS